MAFFEILDLLVYFFSALTFLMVFGFFIKSKHLGFLFLFGFGILYYLVLPLLSFDISLVSEFPGVSLWRKAFEGGRDDYRLVLVYSLFIFFNLYLVEYWIRKVKMPYVSFSILQSKVLLLTLIGLSSILFFLWFQARDMFFRGYTEGYNPSLMGQLATLNLMLNFLSLYCFFIGSKKLKIVFITLLVINSILLLSMGGRMYVVTVLVPWILLTINKGKPVKLKVVACIFAFVALFSFVGVFRSGAFNYSLIAYFIVAEPMFTSYSGASYLANNDVMIFGNPIFLIFSFIGILPSFFVPDKKSLYIEPFDIGIFYEAPFGATSVLVYVLVSFGVVGASFFLYFLSLFFEFFRKNAEYDALMRASYYCCLSVIPFLFFRETFYVSIRAFMVPAVIMPMLLLVINNILRRMSV